jgi:DMSO/TMAO reductase YedYZ heme-binding membrane subunit
MKSAVLNANVPVRALSKQVPKPKSLLLHVAAKPLLFVLCLLPLAWLTYGAVSNSLGANPAEALIRATGDWVLRFLCITLTITPLRQWIKQPALLRFRRMLGLFAYFYVCLHFLSYAWLDMSFVVNVVQRRHQMDRRQALAIAAQGGLRHRAVGLAALLLDAFGEEQL